MYIYLDLINVLYNYIFGFFMLVTNIKCIIFYIMLIILYIVTHSTLVRYVISNIFNFNVIKKMKSKDAQYLS